MLCVGGGVDKGFLMLYLRGGINENDDENDDENDAASCRLMRHWRGEYAYGMVKGYEDSARSLGASLCREI